MCGKRANLSGQINPRRACNAMQRHATPCNAVQHREAEAANRRNKPIGAPAAGSQSAPSARAAAPPAREDVCKDEKQTHPAPAAEGDLPHEWWARQPNA